MSDSTRGVLGADTAIEVRPYQPQDEWDVLQLLTTTLGPGPAGERTPGFFRWKHLESPFGRSFMLVAETDGRIVGLRAFMRWQLRAGNRLIQAVVAVDTATHPHFQGRGIFTRLTREALRRLPAEADLVFNTPNEKSLPGYLKMGWRVVGKVPVGLRVRRPIRFATRAMSRRSGGPADGVAPPGAEPVSEIIRDEGRVSDLLASAFAPERRLATPRDFQYLKWRYGSAPLLDYRAVRIEDHGRLNGLAIFRVRSRGRLFESTVTEVFARPGERGMAGRLLRSVVRSVSVDVLTCHFSPGSDVARAARRVGFLPSPAGITLVVNPLSDAIEPDPTTLGSWALSLGDLEVF